MNIPLLDPPKSRRPRCATALILFGLCTTMSLLWGQPQQEETITNGLPVVREAIPVKYLTVTTRRFVIKDRCGFMETSTQQMPLMELFDELGEREDWAESEASSEQEQEVDLWGNRISPPLLGKLSLESMSKVSAWS